MRQHGVGAWEVAAQLGHKSRDFRTTELYAAFDPSYLSESVKAIELLFAELRANLAPVDEVFFKSVPANPSEDIRKFGAGDAIRTRDPNLGKVMLYP